MFFEDEIYEINPIVIDAFETTFSSNGWRTFPTHTEDGIPIRKLYVSNLPPKTTRNDLFSVFTQFGFIKSCWIRLSDPKGPNMQSSAEYAFITFTDPNDAYKALTAPNYKKNLRGRHLKTSPADSWHQPVDDTNGGVKWVQPLLEHRNKLPTQVLQKNENINPTIGKNRDRDSNMTIVNGETSNSMSEHNEAVQTSGSESEYTILDVLNRDCINNILSYVSLIDLINSETVSKGWQNMIQEYLDGIRIYKTSWWWHDKVPMTTAVLRRLLARVGGSLVRLHINHLQSVLNDRTAHSIGKFCPNLEELMIVQMLTKNWNPLVYGCKKLRILSFISCNRLTDTSLIQLMKSNSIMESLTVTNNRYVTGLFLTSSKPRNLTSLTFRDCFALQASVLCAATDILKNLTTFRLDDCPSSIWKKLPVILSTLTNLEELSLAEYALTDLTPELCDDFCNAFVNLTKLKVLNFTNNVNINNTVLKSVGTYCSRLRALNVSHCNPRSLGIMNAEGVSDEGILAVCRGCPELQRLDVSYVMRLTDAGGHAIAGLSQLTTLVIRGSMLTSTPLAHCLMSCPNLMEVDACGSIRVTEELVAAACTALERTPRPLKLRLSNSGVILEDSNISLHKLLTVDMVEWLDHYLQPPIIQCSVNNSSDEYLSLSDIFEQDADDFDFESDDDNVNMFDDFLDEHDFLGEPDLDQYPLRFDFIFH